MGVSVISTFAIVLIWAISFSGIPASGQIQAPSSRPIQLNICCQDTEEYKIGFDVCGKLPEGTVRQELNPQLYSSRNRDAIPGSISSGGFNVSYNQRKSCEDGTVANISLDFRLLDNGSLLILPMETTIPENKFCIDQYRTLNKENLTGNVVRFCARDPCIDKNCIRKCCPVGMVLNETANLCQIATEKLGFPFHNEFGVTIPSSLAQALAIRDSAASCPVEQGRSLEMFNFLPDVGDCFSIFSNGSLFIPSLAVGEQYSDHYCIDHQMSDDGAQKVVGIICLPPSDEHYSWVFQLYPPLLILSAVFLIATFIVYAIIPEIRNTHGISIMCHVASLAVMYIGLGTIQTNLEFPNWLCIGLAIVTHYAFLSSFTWLSVMSFDIWWAFSNLRPTTKPGRAGKLHTGRRLKFYFIYAWTVPFIIVITGVILDNSADQTVMKCWFENEEERQNYLSSRPKEIVRPHFGDRICWFPNGGAPIVAYLYGPIGFLIFVNLVFFVLTTTALHRASVDTALAAGKQKAKQKFRVIFCIFILMGLTWAFEIISYGIGGDPVFWVVTDVINLLTNGIAIFIMFVCKPTVWSRLQDKFPYLKRLDALCPSCLKKRAYNPGKQTSAINNQDSSGLTLSTATENHPSGNSIDAHNMKVVVPEPNPQ